jgi:hypothetical protein
MGTWSKLQQLSELAKTLPLKIYTRSCHLERQNTWIIYHEITGNSRSKGSFIMYHCAADYHVSAVYPNMDPSTPQSLSYEKTKAKRNQIPIIH